MTTLILAYSVVAYLFSGSVCYLARQVRASNQPPVSAIPAWMLLLWPLWLVETATSKDNTTPFEPKLSDTDDFRFHHNCLELLAQRTDSSWYEEGIAFMEMGQYSEALSHFERISALRPDDCTAFVWHASMLSLLGRHRAALGILDRALALQPRDRGVLLLRGLVFHDLGSYQESYKSYDQAVRLQQEWEQPQPSPSPESIPTYPQHLAKPIGQLLQEAGLLSANEVAAILRYQVEHETHHLRFGEISSRWGLVKSETVEFFAQLPKLIQGQDYPLGQYLKSAALLDEDQISIILDSQPDSGLRFGEIAVNEGLLAQETVDFFVDYVSQS
ncbi:tetratricopeptide repeat protein [Lusitaniella coriacea LEGE 07157]|uniref:Tetratricopeptide repeat protein n=1 Tax=Lusitaniella coriacea LEGE 07157 TaxID=945747 RepID=A0A8J7DVF5_9CYAN|nr:tetratricopeptide repeat protein [Lusitaniella coriacea]MBE9115754.1 tetratricopeptide repeat protein [Lusitaniella coriacea LEGE 07157]